MKELRRRNGGGFPLVFPPENKSTVPDNIEGALPMAILESVPIFTPSFFLKKSTKEIAN